VERPNARASRTLKHALHPPLQPDLSPDDHQRRVDRVLLWYSWYRPHMALGGATPAEAFYGLRPGHLEARSPPRGLRGQRCAPAPFELVLVDEDLRLPALLPRAA